MRFRSFRYSLLLFTVVIILQGIALATHIYLRNRLEIENGRYTAITELKKFFLETLIEEDRLRDGSGEQKHLTKRYVHLQAMLDDGWFSIDGAPFSDRGKITAELALLHRERRLLHEGLNRLLPSLTSSVRYIHEHHLTYLRNLLSRGRLEQDYGSVDDFKRSSVHSATELDIIGAAVSIQVSMLDIFDSFAKLERGGSPASIAAEFTSRIKQFYTMVNTLEDYSLDAQDGLLVEELLLNGRTFEDSFTRFLDIERKIADLENSLRENQLLIQARIAAETGEIERGNRQMKRHISILQQLLVLGSLFMLVFLVLLARKMATTFKRTIEETEKIRSDLSYRIPIDKAEYRETETIFRAMNSMARTIARQVKNLEESRANLELRVAERTRELSDVNEKLVAQIKEREENEAKRSELEAKLSRAEKMEALGALAGGVAHDLNNILSGIMSYPELILLDLDPDDPLVDPIRTIKSSGEKAATIVNDLLTLARRGVASFEPVDLNHVIRQFLASPECEKILLHHPEVEIETSLAADLGGMAGSEVHLSKTIMNLVSNGAEAMEAGGKILITTTNQYVDFTIRGYDNVRQGEYLKLTVQDSGEGIAREDLDRIFEPFFTKKKMGRSGTGLGMAVVWGTVKDHGGYIDVESEPHHGTTFSLYFPMDRRSRVDTTGTFLSPSEYMGKGESVLVVDDVAEQREIGVRILERLGYRVESVASGEEAVEYLQSHQVDILLLDMIMRPGIDGLETYRRIVQFRPGQKAVIASGFSESDRVVEVQRLGAGPYLKKPYSFEQIGVVVREELDRGV